MWAARVCPDMTDANGQEHTIVPRTSFPRSLSAFVIELGATVSVLIGVEPAVAGVDITTGSGGTFLAQPGVGAAPKHRKTVVAKAGVAELASRGAAMLARTAKAGAR